MSRGDGERQRHYTAKGREGAVKRIMASIRPIRFIRRIWPAAVQRTEIYLDPPKKKLIPTPMLDAPTVPEPPLAIS